MASVDLKLDIAYVEDIKRIKVAKGVKGNLILKRNAEDDYTGDVDSAATGDPVLELRASQEDAQVVSFEAKEIGVSRFFFIQKSETEFIIIRQVRVEVVEAIVDQAVSIGLSGEVIDII